MVAYSDVPTVNLLYEEQARIQNGIALIDAGGKVSSFTIIPPPPDPETMAQPMMMSSSIMTINPPQSLNDAARAAMVARDAEITAELAGLGVTADPPEVLVARAEAAKRGYVSTPPPPMNPNLPQPPAMPPTTAPPPPETRQ